MSKLIGIGGKRESGKDATSDWIVEDGQGSWVKLGMSDPLAEALYALNPLVPYEPEEDIVRTADILDWYESYQELYDRVGYVEAKKNPEVRRLLQALGTEVGRNMIDQDVWINIAKRNIQEHLDAGRNVIITGMRFPNELDVITDLGGELWWVDRPGHVPPGESLSSHSSETGVSQDDFAVTIVNDGTLEDLYGKVFELLYGKK